jgi:hypothetical protein
MILSTNDAGTLELFWRHAVSRHPTPKSAEDFLSGLPRRSELASTLRASFPGAQHFTDDRLLFRNVAESIARHEIIVLDYRSEPLWSGSRMAVTSVSPRLLLLSMDKTNNIRDLARALDWLESATHPEAESLWKGLWLRYDRSQDVVPSLHEIVTLTRRLLRSGELVPIYHFLPSRTVVPIQGEQEFATGLAPREPAVEEESATFDAAHDPGPQVRALEEASETGTPFCEVCEQNRRRDAA